MADSVAVDSALLGAVAEGEDWEAVLFDAACRSAQENAGELLHRLDAVLAERRPPGLKKWMRQRRTVLTRFGPVTVKRWVYREQATGRRRQLLDECLGWGKRRAVSPSLARLLAVLDSEMPYRQAAQLLGELVPQSVSKNTAQRLIVELGQRQQSKEQVQADALRDGAAPPAARSVQRLFVEADGLMVPLQREARRRTEIKAAVAYRGTRKIGVDRHGRERRETLGTVSFTGRGPGEPFWEQAWGQFGQHYQLEAIEQVVLGGDGADWIRGALELVGPDQQGVFQLDRFHLARALRGALGPDAGPAVQALRSEQLAVVRACLDQALADTPAGNRRRAIQGVLGYLVANADGLLRWTTQLGVPAQGEPRLGSMETHIDKLLANRLKKKGMSWSIPGLLAMGKARQLRANGQLSSDLFRHCPLPPTPRRDRRHAPARVLPTCAPRRQPPFQASLAPRWGPHSSRPWVQALIRLTRGPALE